MRRLAAFVVFLLDYSGPVRAAAPEQEEWPKLLHTLKGFSYGLSFSPDSKTLAAGGLTLRGDLKADRDVVLWDVATGRDAVRLKGQRDVQSLAFSPDGKLLAAGGEDLRLWDVETGKVVRSAKVDIRTLTFSPDGKVLATGAEASSRRDRTIDFWQVGSLKTTASLNHSNSVRAMTFSPDGKTLAYPGDGAIHFWGLDTEKERLKIDLGSGVSVPHIAFSPDGKVLAAVINYANPARPPATTPSPPRAWDQTDVLLWDTTTGKSAGKLTGHTRIPFAVAFSPDGKFLASAGSDMTVRIWDVATAKTIATLKHQARGLAFSPDGKVLATAAWGGDIKLWSLERGK